MLVAIVVLVLVAMALVECARVVGGFRRAVRLNRAMHELRRPLQGISLSIEGRSADLSCVGACLEQAQGALEELDAVINRRPADSRVLRISVEEIARGLEDRWRFAGVRVAQADGPAALDVDPRRLGAALDNLVSNAVEHGTGPVEVRAIAREDEIVFEVCDGGPVGTVCRVQRRRRDPRHGHGLAVTGELAASCGGAVLGPQRMVGGETVATLSVPASLKGLGPR